MAEPLIAKRKARSLSTALFLVCLAALSYTGFWWPGILLVLGVPLALRQLLSGKYYDMLVSLLVFVGGFAAVWFAVSWQILLPVLLTTGGIYIFFREWVESDSPLAEDEDDMNLEIHEGLGKNKKKPTKKSTQKKKVKAKPVAEAPAKKKKPRKMPKSAPLKPKEVQPLPERL